MPRYKQFKDALNHGYAIKGMGMYEVQRILGNQVQSLCDEICDTAVITKKAKNYVKNNYFSKCGIVVFKSSIPYIF